MFLFEKSVIGTYCNRLYDLKESHSPVSCYGQIKANSAGKNLNVTNVVIQFLSSVVPLTEVAGFTPFLLQLLALRPSTCLISGHPPSSNQSSLSPLPLAFSKSSVVLAFSCHSLQDSEQLSKHYRHPSSAHVHTI